MIIGQLKQKKQLKTIIRQRRLAHGYLFHGNEGVGLLPMALWFAQEIIGSGAIDAEQIDLINNPDVHFIFPVSTNDRIKTKPKSDDFSEQWKQFIGSNLYASQLDWMEHMGCEKKQGVISVHESHSLFQKAGLSSLNSKYKILIIWNADAMSLPLANKCLKLIEEPPQNTIFLLTTTSPQKIISTIRSRLVSLHIPPIEENIVVQQLIGIGIEPKKAKTISKAARGNWNTIQKLLDNQEMEKEFFAHFIFWIRKAFLAKTKTEILKELILWADQISSYSREKQKAFISFCAERFRQALLVHYKANDLVYQDMEDKEFNFRSFSNYVHGKNIESIINQLDLANMEIDRNVNSKFIFLDISIQITRLIHKKAR